MRRPYRCSLGLALQGACTRPSPRPSSKSLSLAGAHWLGHPRLPRNLHRSVSCGHSEELGSSPGLQRNIDKPLLLLSLAFRLLALRSRYLRQADVLKCAEPH